MLKPEWLYINRRRKGEDVRILAFLQMRNACLRAAKYAEIDELCKVRRNRRIRQIMNYAAIWNYPFCMIEGENCSSVKVCKNILRAIIMSSTKVARRTRCSMGCYRSKVS